ncbi:MAG: Ribosomal protein L7Ae/L30e/S12e/Gadd45 family, partial [Firmicutes bacterium]|nr:Ribosomal protein L7Ae/L30e/S12e/Gadd45 family [Bacillota bacterium]
MNEDKLLGLLGLAHRAGFVASGAMQTEKALLSGRCKLLLIAADT